MGQTTGVPTHWPLVQTPVWQGACGSQDPPSLVGVPRQSGPCGLGEQAKVWHESASKGGQGTVYSSMQRPSTHWAEVQPELQSAPKSAGTQVLPSPQTWHVPQELPHSRTVPHSVVTEPHLPSQVICEVQPQTPGVPPPPHVWGAVHSPQPRRLPQSSAAGPHEIPWDAQVVVGTQTH